MKRLGLRPTAKPRSSTRRPPTTDTFGWTNLLQTISTRWLTDADYAATLDDKVVRQRWLGQPPARVSEVRDLERRLGATLPPSYAALLVITNGFLRISSFIDELLPAADVRPFATDNADWIAAYSKHNDPNDSSQHLRYGDEQDPAVFDRAHFATTIQISASWRRRAAVVPNRRHSQR